MKTLIGIALVTLLGFEKNSMCCSPIVQVTNIERGLVTIERSCGTLENWYQEGLEGLKVDDKCVIVGDKLIEIEQETN